MLPATHAKTFLRIQMIPSLGLRSIALYHIHVLPRKGGAVKNLFEQSNRSQLL